ncbi:hypothetical protein [Actinoplanes philippinensis]|uniref:hypothetical protein n=1 Tax=Actinoplanes philippinensis TaxID=35752 RepID=UPI0033C45FF1
MRAPDLRRRAAAVRRLRAQEDAKAGAATRARRLAAGSAFYDWLIAEEKTERANPAAISSKSKPNLPRASPAE